jgi:hypothetical protein
MDKLRVHQDRRSNRVTKLKRELLKLSREDLLEIQRAIDDLLPSAPLVSTTYNYPEDTQGEWNINHVFIEGSTDHPTRTEI